MRIVGLVSGGKDSCYNLLECVAAGHEVVALAHLISANKDEIDSFMYQTVGQTGVARIAEAMCLPLYSRVIAGDSLNTGMSYAPSEGDEVEDLFELLKIVKNSCDVEGVGVGAVLSDYQRVRVESVCSRLNLTPLAYLWRRNQEEVLHTMIDVGIHAILIKVASIGLDPRKHLGKSLSEVKDDLERLKHLYGSSVLGEGGEFETFTLDCPLFRKAIKIEEKEVVMHSNDDIAPVAYIRFKALSLEPKESRTGDWRGKVHSPLDFVREIAPSCTEKRPRTHPSPHLHAKPCLLLPKMECIDLSDSFFKLIIPVTEGKIGRALHLASEYLKENKLDLRFVTQVLMFVKSMESYSSMNAKYGSFFHVDPPSRACVETPLPANVDALVELTVSRELPGTLLVRSVSHWAPAVIGPYSQASFTESSVFVAGQIGLVPGSMELIPGGAKEQSMLALRHVARVLNVVTKPEFDHRLPQVFDATCYLVNRDDRIVVEETWKAGGRCETVGAMEIVDTVIVSALPRNALIEWHVKGRWCDLEDVITETSSSTVLESRVTRKKLSCRNGSFYHESLLLETITNESEASSDTCETALRDVLPVLFEQRSKNASVTIFYSFTKLDFDSVQGILSDCGRKGLVVPVVGFATDDAFALIKLEC